MKNDLENKKGFIFPELQIVLFTSNDIILTSGDFDDENDDGTGDDF